MKILWLSQNLPYPPTWGVLQRNYNLLREICERHDVYLIAFNQKALLPTHEEKTGALKVLRKICRTVDVVDLPSDRSKYQWYKLVLKSLFTAHPYSVNWLKSQEMHSKIRQITQNVKFDLVYYDTIGLSEYFTDTGYLSKILNHHNIESILMKRRSIQEENVFKRLYCSLEAKKLEWYEKIWCHQFHINIVVSRQDKTTLQTLIPDLQDVRVVSNGVDIEYFDIRNDQMLQDSLIFTGPMNWYPNRDAVTFFCREIWPLLKREVSTASFTIVGSSPPREVIQMSGHDHSIKITGFVDDVRGYIGKAMVYVCPIRIGGGTRLKILNALAMGKAVVSTSVGCEGLDVTHGKDILIADTPHEFVQQIQRVLKDSTLRASLGNEGRKLVVEKYSWQRIGKTLNDLCESLKG